jgi:hypothetical protein
MTIPMIRFRDMRFPARASARLLNAVGGEAVPAGLSLMVNPGASSQARGARL